MRHEGAKSAVALELMHHDELSDEPRAILYADCMMPERKRLARTLFLRVPLWSPEGISACEISLLFVPMIAALPTRGATACKWRLPGVFMQLEDGKVRS